jgi:hypothetical protein
MERLKLFYMEKTNPKREKKETQALGQLAWSKKVKRI